MTAFPPAEESPREAVANVIMAMRGEIDAIRRAPLTAIPVQTFGTVLAESLDAWASRLGRAIKMLDEAEQSRRDEAMEGRMRDFR